MRRGVFVSPRISKVGGEDDNVFVVGVVVNVDNEDEADDDDDEIEEAMFPFVLKAIAYNDLSSVETVK